MRSINQYLLLGSGFFDSLIGPPRDCAIIFKTGSEPMAQATFTSRNRPGTKARPAKVPD